jgi:uncharacterized protein (DUF433 family)
MNNKLYEKPSSLGTYSIPSAALYIVATASNGSKLKLNTKHLYYWTRDGLVGGYLKGIHNRRLFINFRDLVSLRAIAAMRAKGMKHEEIMTAEKALRKRYGWDYPFATVEFWTMPPKDIFIKEGKALLSASRHMQSAMNFFEEYMQPLHNLTFDIFGVSATWRPCNSVLFDPQIQYGEPCIEGTRVATQVIWSFHKAGDSVENLSYFYGIQPNRIEDAIRWENRIQEVARPKRK